MTTPKDPDELGERRRLYANAQRAIEALKHTCTNRAAKAELAAAYSAIVMAHTYEYNAKKVSA